MTAWGAGYYWPRLLQNFQLVIPAVRSWIITSLPYENVQYDSPATYFVDPPYNNMAGRRYRYHTLNFDQLAE